MGKGGGGGWTIWTRWGHSRGEVKKVVVDNSKMVNVLAADSRNV